MSARSRIGHLTSRFGASLVAKAPGPADETWVRLNCTDAEFACWKTMQRADRAESLVVARAAATALGRDADPVWIAAALCHDVGKSDAHLGTVARAGATAVAAVVSHGRTRTWTNRVGRYVNHDEIGAAQLRAAGARPEVATWADVHHRPERWARCGIPAEICAVLAEADGDAPSG